MLSASTSCLYFGCAFYAPGNEEIQTWIARSSKLLAKAPWGGVLAADSIGVFKLHFLHGCLLDSVAHLLTRSLFSHIWQTALTRRTAKLARASGSLARSVAAMAYCCAQAVRADTSSLAMPPATHIRQALCFCMFPASRNRQTHRFAMFPASCIWASTAFCNVVCKP